MVTVNMPRASWEITLMCLQYLRAQGHETLDLINEIENQVYSQEY